LNLQCFVPALTASACCLALMMPVAAAQTVSEEEELALAYGDKTTISIATGSRQALRRAPAVASVITAEDIAAMGATDLDQVLEAVPGMHVSRNNQAYMPVYVVRGIYSDLNPQTLVLQNGVPMTTLLLGNRGIIWAGLPVHNIARIEVIRGPGSALYGADAFAGVINIITRGAEDTSGTEVGARASTQRFREGWVQHGGRTGPLAVAAYLRAAKSDGFERTIDSDAQTGLDALFGTSASLAPGRVNTGYGALDAGLEARVDKLRLRAGYKRREDVGTGAGIAGALDPIGKMASERTHLDLGWTDVDLAPGLRLALNASYLRYAQEIPVPVQVFPPGAFGGAFPRGMFGAPNTWERQTRLSAALACTGLAGHNVRIGLGHDDLDLYRTREFKNFSVITSGPLTGVPVPTAGGAVVEFPVEDSFLAPHRRKVNYVYVQDEWSVANDWTLTAGVRHDRYSDVGSTTNPRVAVVWDASLDLTAKLLHGTAFRAPSFNDRYGVNPVASGNPLIRPETIRTTEAVVQWHASPALQFNVSIFRYGMSDIIRTTPNPAPAPGATFRNAGSQHGSGAELEWAWDARRALRIAGSYAYQRSIDDATGTDAGLAPRHHVNMRADWAVAGSWVASGQLNHVTDRRRPAGDLRPQIADYTTVDLTLRTSRVAQGWEWSATLLNAFDADVREPTFPSMGIVNDLPMPRRSLSVQAAYRF
jgi:outer membrane receptor for ferrienterochelin and colicin